MFGRGTSRSLNVWLEESEENAHELFTLEELYHFGKIRCGF